MFVPFPYGAVAAAAITAARRRQEEERRLPPRDPHEIITRDISWEASPFGRYRLKGLVEKYCTRHGLHYNVVERRRWLRSAFQMTVQGERRLVEHLLSTVICWPLLAKLDQRPERLLDGSSDIA